jgi:hypothetical protein
VVGDQTVSDYVQVQIKIPAEVWEDICRNAHHLGSSRNAEMVARLRRGAKPPRRDYSKPSEPVRPKVLLGAEERLSQRALKEERELLEMLDE